MSTYYERRRLSIYNNSHNQQNKDKPFKIKDTSNNLFQAKTLNHPNQNQKYENNKTSDQNLTNSYENSLKIRENKKIYNSYSNIINNIDTKNKKQNNLLYKANKNNNPKLFNLPKKTTSNNDIERIENKDANLLVFSSYTTPRNRKYRNNYNNNRNKESSNKNDEKISKIELTEYYDENCGIIKNYAYKENQNINYKTYMEDKGRSISNIKGDPDKALFCLFDGHGGDKVSKFLQNNFINYFKQIPQSDDIKEELINLFKKIDEKLKEQNCYQVGSTACIIYITKEKGKKCLYSVNIGDTRAILISKNDYKRLSYDHKANDNKEQKRIIKDGGIVFGGRVYGSLMLGRAFGDWELKSYGLSCEPYITRINIKDNDKYAIIATDGVWDVLEDIDVYDISKNFENSKDLCNKIVDKSIKKGSMDNISCFVISLN